MVEVKIKIALVLIAILIFAAPIAIAQEVPAHVVISEVQIATNEFVELYNPTNSAIDMTGWHWCYFSSGRNWNNSWRDKTFPPGAIIPAHSFYLIGLKGFPEPSSDWQVYTSTQLADSGSVGIFPWDPDTKTAEEAKAGKIDAVGWGSATYVYETATASTPGSGESIERKPLKEGYAPCQDTDDNFVDFAVQDTPTPKNTLSPEMEPAPVELFDAAGDFKGGFVNIQDAVDNASNGDTIRVDDGTYTENVDVNKQLTILSEHGAAVTTISAPNPNDNVIAVTNANNVNISGFNVAGATAKGGIYLYNADYCNIANNSASNNKIGIHLQMSRYNTITNNTVSDNEDGIWLAQSDHNTITNNTVSDNNQNGIRLHVSNNNLIYNNYFDNTNNAVDDENNIWNITKTPGTNIIGGHYLGGNYWSDYTGVDTDDDGLGDTLVPYNSSGDIVYGGDSHPLVHEAVPSLSIEKSGDPDLVPPGGTLNYTISVKNTGYAPATNVNVTETYDANVTFISAVPAPSRGNDKWIFDTLDVSETKWINISVTVNPTTPNGTVLYNSVNVSCDEGVTDSATENTTVYVTFPPPEITFFAPPSPVNDPVGAWRTFNVTVNQTVNVSWYLDAEHRHTNESVQEASFKWQAVEGEHNVTAKASNVNGSDSHSWIWNVKSISVTKVGDVKEAAPSTLVNFNITVINIGDSNLTQVVVKDELPQGMIYKSSVSDADMTQDGMDITWYFNESLAVNHSETIELVVEIAENATGWLNNTVDVTGTQETGDEVRDEATAEVRVIRLEIEKSCASTVSLGGTVTYTITYSNLGETNLTNVVITENYPDGLTFISADPAPDSGTNNKWTIGTLRAGESGKITIKMKVPDSTLDLSYTENGSVAGEGIVIISKEMSTVQKPYKLENIVTISGSYKETKVSATASAITTVSASGSSLEITEHGSGTYESEEESSLSLEDGGIHFDKTTKAEYSPTTFKCSDGFVMEVPSKWSQDICIHNYAKGIAIHKTITAATTLEDETKIDTKNNGYSMKFDSKFLGYLHVGKKTKVAATSEHYIGEFEITSWDQGGKGIVDGVGYVIVDKDLASGRLLLMEHGSGSYESEEDSSSSKIEKDTYAVYEPTQFNFSDSFVVNFSSKWMQDFCTTNKKGTTALHKKIRDATYIDDDTIATSSPSLKYETYFYGAAHWGERVSKARTSNDYIGKFYLYGEAKTNRTDMFEWGKVPGEDEHQLKTQLSRPPFDMDWVDDAEFTKSDNNRTINITDTMGDHSAEIILSEDNETAILRTDDGKKFEFSVEEVTENKKKELLVYYIELVEVTDRVMGEGFVMVDELEGGMHLIEHGSGSYYSLENFVPNTIYKNTYGEYKPTYFKFADSFAVNFSSLWVQDICVKNKDEGTAIHKRISDASIMKDDTTVTKSSKSSKTLKSSTSLMNITSSFNGSMHIGARTENVSISEDYVGEFNVTELIKIVKKEPKSSSSATSNWLFCPCPNASSTYPWFCQDPTYKGRWLSDCPYPYADTWLYIHP